MVYTWFCIEWHISWGMFTSALLRPFLRCVLENLPRLFLDSKFSRSYSNFKKLCIFKNLSWRLSQLTHILQLGLPGSRSWRQYSKSFFMNCFKTQVLKKEVSGRVLGSNRIRVNIPQICQVHSLRARVNVAHLKKIVLKSLYARNLHFALSSSRAKI